MSQQNKILSHPKIFLLKKFTASAHLGWRGDGVSHCPWPLQWCKGVIVPRECSAHPGLQHGLCWPVVCTHEQEQPWGFTSVWVCTLVMARSVLILCWQTKHKKIFYYYYYFFNAVEWLQASDWLCHPFLGTAASPPQQSDSRCSSCWLRLSQPPSMVPHALSLSPSLCSLAFLAVQLVEKQNHFQCWSLTFSDPFLWTVLLWSESQMSSSTC